MSSTITSEYTKVLNFMKHNVDRSVMMTMLTAIIKDNLMSGCLNDKKAFLEMLKVIIEQKTFPNKEGMAILKDFIKHHKINIDEFKNLSNYEILELIDDVTYQQYLNLRRGLTVTELIELIPTKFVKFYHPTNFLLEEDTANFTFDDLLKNDITLYIAASKVTNPDELDKFNNRYKTCELEQNSNYGKKLSAEFDKLFNKYDNINIMEVIYDTDKLSALVSTDAKYKNIIFRYINQLILYHDNRIYEEFSCIELTELYKNIHKTNNLVKLKAHVIFDLAIAKIKSYDDIQAIVNLTRDDDSLPKDKLMISHSR